MTNLIFMRIKQVGDQIIPTQIKGKFSQKNLLY